jgi:hypothetical protein
LKLIPTGYIILESFPWHLGHFVSGSSEGKSLPFLSQLQNHVQVGGVEEKGGRAGPFIDPFHGLGWVAGIQKEVLRAPLAEDVVDHLTV